MTNSNTIPPGLYPLIVSSSGLGTSTIANSTLTVGTPNARLQLTSQVLDLIIDYNSTDLPPLTATREQGDQVTISWPYWATGFTLQTNSDLATTNWGNYGGVVSSSNTVTAVAPENQSFFRLK